jgi:hypothetical protein
MALWHNNIFGHIALANLHPSSIQKNLGHFEQSWNDVDSIIFVLKQFQSTLYAAVFLFYVYKCSYFNECCHVHALMYGVLLNGTTPNYEIQDLLHRKF